MQPHFRPYSIWDGHVNESSRLLLLFVLRLKVPIIEPPRNVVSSQIARLDAGDKRSHDLLVRIVDVLVRHRALLVVEERGESVAVEDSEVRVDEMKSRKRFTLAGSGSDANVYYLLYYFLAFSALKRIENTAEPLVNAFLWSSTRDNVDES